MIPQVAPSRQVASIQIIPLPIVVADVFDRAKRHLPSCDCSDCWLSTTITKGLRTQVLTVLEGSSE